MTLATSTALAILAAAGGEGPFNAADMIVSHISNSESWGFGTSKAVVMMALAASLVLVVTLRAASGYDANGVPRTRLAQMMDPFVQHFYNDIAIPQMGAKWARRLTPLLLNFFFFILACNLLGLVPLSEIAGGLSSLTGWHVLETFSHGAATPTGNLNVTVTLALITFVAIQVLGVIQQGPVSYAAHFLGPPGVPIFVRPLLLLVEVLSMFVKPIALTMRLGINMTAGHIAILALLSIIFIVKNMSAAAALAAGAVAVFPIVIGITALEIIVSFVQAYVFALLSGVFIGMAVHAHH